MHEMKMRFTSFNVFGAMKQVPIDVSALFKYVSPMKLRLNRFVIINILCIVAFIFGIFGLIDWALGSVILIAGVGLSTFLGSFFYSNKFIDRMICRWVFALGVLSSGYFVFKFGEYLNQNIYDGLVTLSVVVYVLLATALLHYLGRRSS